jgi:hypothetical protein
MRHTLILPMLAALLAAVPLSPAAAASSTVAANAAVPAGSVIITTGEPEKAASYISAPKDASGLLTSVEALCTKGPVKVDKTTAQLLSATDKSPTAAKKGLTWSLTRAGYIQILGGKVTFEPKPKSPRHCVISGIAPADLAKAWGICKAGGGC